jgi:hypothetical protein
MASGHVNRTKGRTHGYTDQPAGREKVLANSEPSKHGTTERSVFASATQQEISQHDGFIMLFITRGKNEGDGAMTSQRS